MAKLVLHRFALSFTIVALAPCALAQWTYQDLHPAGANSSIAYGTSSGYTIGGKDLVSSVGGVSAGRALVWHNGVVSDITPSSAIAAQLLATQGGNHVGQVNLKGVSVAGYWFGATPTFVNLSSPKGVSSSIAFAIYNGQQGGYIVPKRSVDSKATIWSGTVNSSVDLHPNGWDGSEVRGIFNGTQVGGAYNALTPGLHACRWFNTRNSFLDMHPAGFDASEAVDVYGSVAVGFVYTVGGPSGIQDRKACRWDTTTGAAVIMNPLGWAQSIARGVAPGAIVGSVYDSNPGGLQHAFFWNTFTNGFLDLHSVLPYGVYETSAAFHVWANGTHLEVSGTAKDIATGQQHAILWKFDPEV